MTSRRRRLTRPTLLAVLGALALAGAVPAEAAGAPRVGRWVGTNAHGTNVSFTIHAVGGRRYIANEVSVCGTSGGANPWVDIPGSDSYGWPVDRKGRIRDLKSSVVAPESMVKGRLGRTSGIVRGLIGIDITGPPGTVGCLPFRQSVRVRWVGAPVVESGRWEMTGQMGSHGSWWVIGGAALYRFSGDITVPILDPDVLVCGAGGPVYEDAWIQPDGAFAAGRGDDPGHLTGRFNGASASGTYAASQKDHPCDLGSFPFTARLVERQPAPRVGRLVLPPPIPGGGSQPPSGPCGKPTTVKVDPVEAISCFRDRGGVKVSSATVRVNGIDVVPARGSEVRLDPDTAHLTTTGPAEVRLPVGAYATTTRALRVWRGRLDWPLRRVKGFKVRSLGDAPLPASPPAIAEHAIVGLPIVGSAEFAFEPGSSRGKVSVKLPKKLFGEVTADVGLKLTNEAGVQVNELKLTFPAVLLKKVGLTDASLAMTRGTTGALHWDGTATAELQRDTGVDEIVDRNPLTLKVELGFGRDGYFRLAGSADGINRQIYRGIFLQRLGLVGQRNPLKFSGNIGFSAGPQVEIEGVGRREAASLDGTYELQFGSPTCYQATTKGKIVIAELFSSRIRMCSNGLVEGEFSLRSAPVPLFSINGRLTGWVFQDRAFNLEGTAQASMPGISRLAEVVVSSEGMAACLAGTRVGFGYRWRDGHMSKMAGSCGIGPWRAARPATAGAAVQGQAFRVRRGQRVAVVSAVGTTAAPTVTLVGPRGERLTAGAAGHADERSVAFQDPNERVSYLAIADPSPGTWRLQVEPGSAPVSGIRTATPRPPVRIRARVHRGKGGALRLRYRARGLAGGRVRFVETARGIRHVIGTSGRARGTLRFRPAASTAVRRRIVATVVRDGTPEPARPVVRFRARTPRAAPPRRVRVHSRGLRRVITWSGPRDRAYRVSVRISDGRRLLFLPGRRHRVTVRPVLRDTRVRASVRAVDRLGRPGPARTASSPPARRPRPRAPKPCAAVSTRANC